MAILEKINPLNVLDQRKLNFMPIHFEKAKIFTFFSTEINNWIYENLTGRYAVIQLLSLNDSRQYYTSTVIGFEDPKELLFTLMACPHINERS